ncbi:LysR substrate-binding domain-containing protein [Glaciimonas sp. CA11.2]|uniref:LysR family transcriptional regulator n=1 Tax=unclassified Glaciimonas TaxID=2644401 RepID=UPI002AB354E3|nr:MULTISPECIES: LysR substrate-binding domain-containing protein [unclassified Glaciimonas]MDY7547106.1 LysR substrate-binding domain-containing protein [Glaciimonas sp. CA11.2]MEB0011050.1 LysR substrate-binding domain-containing protein [Glaciimonas sp. Cout2]MEB0081273.1 LysR substrate-binding domain-containing protein [Glaciimonas sp. Gout2]MEB0161999.1 LysR substrate-binding domain-containing protein [Glaciimonas sp. CA11.2]
MIDISSRVLRAMIALAELRNFSLAAERCHVTQSALSQMVQKLEGDVGLQLVDRNRRNVGFTAEGLRFIATAQRVMHELDEIDHDLKEHASGRRGRVSIAALPSLAAHWLPQMMAKYSHEFPGIELNLFDVATQRALELVRTRQADFAVTADGPGRPGLESRLLFKEKFFVVCHKTHALAQKKYLALSDLSGYPYIRLVRTGSIAQYLESALRTVNLIDTGLEVDQVSTVAGLVASNLGVSVVPELTIPYFDGKHVVAIPITSSDLNRPIYLVWPVDRKQSKAAQQFIDLLDQNELPMQLKVRPHSSALAAVQTR